MFIWWYTRVLTRPHEERIALLMWILTAEGRTPPSAVYKESFPTGIPIPWKFSQIVTNWFSHEREREREDQYSNHSHNSIYFRWLSTCVLNNKLLIELTWQPRSPSPKIRSPSVTTMTWIFFSGQFLKTSRIFPLQKD